jgi:DNA transposition AAA+ family ATPase
MSSKKLKIAGEGPSWDEDLRYWLQEYIAKHPHHTTEILSRSYYIGVARSALDAYLEGTYFLPKEQGGQGVNPKNSNIENSIRAFRISIEGTVRHGYANTFVETRSWVQLQNACRTAITENVIVVVHGKPGVGKSRCLKEFASRHMTTAPIVVLCSSLTTTRFFAQKIARTLKLDEEQTTVRLEDAIAEKLKRYPRPLFIDQANYLSENALGMLCYIWEVACVGIVLSGTKDLYDLFTTSRLTEGVRSQIASRIAVHYFLAELSLSQAKAIIKRALGPDASDEAITLVCNITGRIHRHVDMIMPRIFELKEIYKKELESGGMTIRDIIRIAGSRLMV